MEPIIQNYMSEGYSWKKNNVTYDMVVNKNMHIKEGSENMEFCPAIIGKSR